MLCNCREILTTVTEWICSVDASSLFLSAWSNCRDMYWRTNTKINNHWSYIWLRTCVPGIWIWSVFYLVAIQLGRALATETLPLRKFFQKTQFRKFQSFKNKKKNAMSLMDIYGNLEWIYAYIFTYIYTRTFQKLHGIIENCFHIRNQHPKSRIELLF